MIKIIISLILLFSILTSFSQPTHTQDFKGLWITGFKANVLGNISAEDSVLTYASNHDFNYLICTNIFQILTTGCSPFTSDMVALKDFIQKAHNIYGIEYISGNVGSDGTAQKIKDYNECTGVSSAEKFDMITYECEFYNSGTNASCPDFASYMGQLANIKNICETTTASNDLDSLVCEVYIGGSGSTGAVLTNSSQSEMQQIANMSDHVLLTYYRTLPSSSSGNFFNWTINRLQWLAGPDVPTDIVILLKSRDTDGNNMHDYLVNYGGSHTDALKDPYFSWVEGTAYNPTLTNGYVEQFNSGALPWLSGIKVVGYAWFEHLANMQIRDTVTLEVDEHDVNNNISVYPNPSNGIITIKHTNSENNVTFRIVNSVGQLVMDENQLYGQKNVQLGKGIYFLITDQEGIQVKGFKKIVIY